MTFSLGDVAGFPVGDAAGFPMPFGSKVVRLRRQLVPDPYNPDVPRLGEWVDASRFPIEGAFVGEPSGSMASQGAREQLTIRRAVFVPAGTDLRAGDRVEAGGGTYDVVGGRSGDPNPFTGWRPLDQYPVEEVAG